MKPEDILKEYEEKLSHQDFEQVRNLISENAVFYFNEGKVQVLENDVTQVFKVVFQRLDNLEEETFKDKNKKKIGLKDES